MCIIAIWNGYWLEVQKSCWHTTIKTCYEQKSDYMEKTNSAWKFQMKTH